MVYSGVVDRTQIYLGDDELALLDKAEHDTGASRSELVRRAVRSTYGALSGADRVAALERSAGVWAGHRLTGAGYVDERRGDLEERLRRHGL